MNKTSLSIEQITFLLVLFCLVALSACNRSRHDTTEMPPAFNEKVATKEFDGRILRRIPGCDNFLASTKDGKILMLKYWSGYDPRTGEEFDTSKIAMEAIQVKNAPSPTQIKTRGSNVNQKEKDRLLELFCDPNSKGIDPREFDLLN